MAAATGTVVISQGGSSFDSATYPRFVLGDGTNSLEFVIDNDMRQLKLQDESTAATSWSSTSDYPFEDPMRLKLAVPTFDEVDSGTAQSGSLALIPSDFGTMATVANSTALTSGGSLISISSRLHFELRDAAGNKMRLGFGKHDSDIGSNATLLYTYGTNNPYYRVYMAGS